MNLPGQTSHDSNLFRFRSTQQNQDAGILIEHPDFSSLARNYPLLETIAFGPALGRARLAWIDRIRFADPILLIGDGDGRFLTALLRINQTARITSIDCSRGMIDRARRRVERTRPEALDRVDWHCRDIRNTPLPPAAFQAVVTHFFLDCFSEADVTSIHTKLSRSLTRSGQWLWSDFVIPQEGFRRIFARGVVALLYRFFRWQTGITARQLPSTQDLFAGRGLTQTNTRRFLFDAIESSVWTAE